MAHDKETFLSRWSRLKSETKELPEAKAQTPVPELPAVDKLTPESDFSGFMHPKVEDALRRAALRKLFDDPHFNVPDPFEPFSGDWTGEALSEETLATLNQARTLLFDEQKKKEEEASAAAAQLPATEGKAEDDEPGRQDT